MIRSSYQVKRADSLTDTIRSKMHVNGGGVQGFMPKESLDGKQVGTILVKMGAEGMAEGMAGQTVWPAKPLLVGMDMSGEIEGVDGLVSTMLFWKEPVCGSAVSKPVLGQDGKSFF